ncbi:hypothetical protein GWI33_014009, partial [Rhynchophorus ferrugineus]
MVYSLSVLHTIVLLPQRQKRYRSCMVDEEKKNYCNSSKCRKMCVKPGSPHHYQSLTDARRECGLLNQYAAVYALGQDSAGSLHSLGSNRKKVDFVTEASPDRIVIYCDLYHMDA